MKRLQIKTAQNINITFTLADILHRLGAFFIDNVLKFMYIYILIRLSILNGLTAFHTDYWSKKAFVIVLMLPVTLYSLYSELLMDGQTVGKKLLNIKIISIDGFKPSTTDFIIRWFLRIVDFNFFILILIYTSALGINQDMSYVFMIIFFGIGKLVGFLLILYTDNNQRLGDIISKTIVINLKDTAKFSETILENLTVDYVPTYPNVINFSDNDMRLIKDSFKNMDRSRDEKALTKLRSKIEEVANIKSKEKNDKEFIDKVLKDYSFYTQNG